MTKLAELVDTPGIHTALRVKCEHVIAARCDLGDQSASFLIRQLHFVKILSLCLLLLAQGRAACTLRFICIFLLFSSRFSRRNAQSWALTPAENTPVCREQERCLVRESYLHDEVLRDLLGALVERPERLSRLRVRGLVLAVLV